MRLLLLLLALPLLAGCAVLRPQRVDCPAFAAGSLGAALSTQGGVLSEGEAARMTDRMAERAEEGIEDALRARVAGVAPGRSVTFDVVTLSAGGQFGAFGAGFLSGWSGNGRPEFEFVTGVSAGAILAPAAFAGPAFDGLLSYYDGLGRDGVLRLRPSLAWAAAPSVAVPAPLEAFLTRALDAELLATLAAGDAAGRQLLIGATNVDAGTAEVFDLGAAARAPGAALCIREAMLASAAIPGLFPPRDLNGALHADGGLRQHVFLRALERARRSVEAGSGVDIRVEAYLIVNGALLPPARPVDDALPAYVVRSVEILADEVLRASIEDALDFAEGRPDWRLRGMRAELPAGVCAGGVGEGEVGGFDPCLTAALFAHGRARAMERPIDWLDEAELRRLAREL